MKNFFYYKKAQALRIFWLLATAAGLTACANIIPPAGGAKDETPPKVVEALSTPNLQTNFVKQTIELSFDEWVQLQDVFTQVVISPPLRYPFDVSLRKRTVLFAFDEREVLRSDATYTLNFGESVKDLTERNPAEDLRFVFSTGSYIDSLIFSGTIVDARTAEPVKGALFMLYDNLSDTVVRTERPFYFARADEKGQFTIENVKPGAFKGFALLDADLNYLYNQASEKIGFPPDTLTVGQNNQAIEVRLFEPEKKLTLQGADASRYGLLKLIFSGQPRDLSLDYQNIGQKIVYEYERDTLRVWYDTQSEERWEFYVRQDTLLNDTARVTAVGRATFLSGARLTEGTRSPLIKVNPSKTATLTFNRPLEQIDTSRVLVLEDTLKTRVQAALQIDSVNRRQLNISIPWREKISYEVLLLPGAVTDMYGIANDTTRRTLVVGQAKEYGNMLLRGDSLPEGLNLVVQVLSQDGGLVNEFQTKGKTSFEADINALTPSNYTLQVVADLNGNGRWDSGDYDQRRQPEPVKITKLDALRASWDLEVAIRPPL